jgi:hypothetical protein
MPWGDRLFSIELDLLEHAVRLRDSDGRARSLPLVPRSVRDVHAALFAELAEMDVHPRIDPVPQECPIRTPFTECVEHASYDRAQVGAFWHALRRMEPVLQTFRARFRGKCSPVHFFWGGFDLAVTRFNGRRAPPRKSLVDRDAYDEEVISLGFWPGDPWTGATEAFFYSYTAPAPEGLASAPVRPDAASWSEKFAEFVLPYDDVRRASDPAKAILDFAESTYDAGSTLAGWDRAGLAYP